MILVVLSSKLFIALTLLLANTIKKKEAQQPPRSNY